MQEELKLKLTGLGLAEEQVGKLEAEGVKDGAGMALLSGDDVKSITGCGLVIARQVAAAFAPPPAAAPAPQMISLDVLPKVPDDEAWMASFQSGGNLRFETNTVVGAVSAAMADKVGLFEVTDKIVAKMEAQAKRLDEPVPEQYYEIEQMLLERRYAEQLKVLGGARKRHASEAKKKELLKRIEIEFWPEVLAFHGVLKAWYEMYQNDPSRLTNALSQVLGSAGLGVAEVPTDHIRSAAEGLIDAINRIFSGTGLPAMVALAYDAQQIRKAIEIPGLPALVGAASKEIMLKDLGVAVSGDYRRQEELLRTYVLSAVEFPKQSAGMDISYLVAMMRIGAGIQWDKLGSTVVPLKAGLGRDVGQSGRHRVNDDR